MTKKIDQMNKGTTLNDLQDSVLPVHSKKKKSESKEKETPETEQKTQAPEEETQEPDKKIKYDKIKNACQAAEFVNQNPKTTVQRITALIPKYTFQLHYNQWSKNFFKYLNSAYHDKFVEIKNIRL